MVGVRGWYLDPEPPGHVQTLPVVVGEGEEVEEVEGKIEVLPIGVQASADEVRNEEGDVRDVVEDPVCLRVRTEDSLDVP